MKFFYVPLFNYWPIVCGLSLFTESYSGFSYLTILYLISTILLIFRSISQFVKPNLISISILSLTAYLIIQNYSMGLNHDLSSLFWILQLYFCYCLSYYFYTTFKFEPDAFVRPILKMGFLSSTVGYLQIFLNTRFLPEIVDQRLDPEIFRSPLFGLYRLSGFSLSPNAFGLFTSFIICLAFVYRKELIKTKFKINLLLLYMIPTLLLSFSRGSILILLLIVPLYLFPSQKTIINFAFLISISFLFILVSDYNLIEFFVGLDPRTKFLTYIFNYFNFIGPINLLFGLGFSDEILYLVGFADNFYVEVLVCGGLIFSSLLIIFCRTIYKSIRLLLNKFNILKISIFYILLSMLFYSSLNLLYFSTLPLFIVFYCVHYISSTQTKDISKV